MKLLNIIIKAVVIYLLLKAIDNIFGNVIIDNFKLIIFTIGGIFILLQIINMSFWAGYYMGNVSIEINDKPLIIEKELYRLHKLVNNIKSTE